MRTRTWILALMAGMAMPAHAIDAARAPHQAALGTHYVVLDAQDGDLTGDGRVETAVCYRASDETHGDVAGIALLGMRRGADVPLFHTQIEGLLCDGVRIEGHALVVTAYRAGDAKTAYTLKLVHKKNLHLRGEKGHVLTGATISSSPAMPGHLAKAALDGALSTSWAEDEEGTGIGARLTVTLPAAVRLGAVGITPGASVGRATYDAKNRPHRGSFAFRTAEDLSDDDSGLDFAALGVELLGERATFSLPNAPGVRYVPVDADGVREVEVRIDSVYLGSRDDDTHVLELEFVPRLRAADALKWATGKGAPHASTVPAKATGAQPAATPVEPAAAKAPPAQPAAQAPAKVRAEDKPAAKGEEDIFDDDF